MEKRNDNTHRKQVTAGSAKSQVDYSRLFPQRKDGRYQTNYKGRDGRWHTLTDADPERLYNKLQQLQNVPAETFRDISDEWMDQKAEQVGWKTAEAYAAPLRRLQERFGEDTLDSITPTMITAFLSLLGRQGYARRTVQMHRDIMNMVYQYAIATGKTSETPMPGVVMPKGLTSTKRQPPTDDALKAIHAHPEACFYDFAMFLALTGLRRGELLGLRAEDIDIPAKRLRVQRAVEYVGNRPEVKLPKTTAGVRSVLLPDALIPLIPQSGGYLWHMDGDEEAPLTKQAFRKRWEKFKAETGTDVSCHQFRHYYATVLYEAGVPVLTAQHALGHANASTTMGIYTHLREKQEQLDAEAMQEIFRSDFGA